MKDRLTDAGYGLGWSVVCRLPESWAQRGFRFAADLAWRRQGTGVQVLEGNLPLVIVAVVVAYVASARLTPTPATAAPSGKTSAPTGDLAAHDGSSATAQPARAPEN